MRHAVRGMLPHNKLGARPAPQAQDLRRHGASARGAAPRSARDQGVRRGSSDLRATGKRKTSVARVILTPGVGKVVVNGSEIDDYFGRKVLETIAAHALRDHPHRRQVRRQGQRVRRRHRPARPAPSVTASRAPSCEADETLRTPLKRAGFLTRDARKVERKKAGLKARKNPQFSKR